MSDDITILKDGTRLYKHKAYERLKASGRIAAQVLHELVANVKEGVTTFELNSLAEQLIKDAGATPAFKGYEGYPFATCLSVNEHIVHGLPNNRPLKNGDVISVDVGVIKDFFYSDNARTVVVGGAPSEHDQLIEAAQRAYNLGLEKALPGNYTGDIGHEIHKAVLQNDLDPQNTSLGKKFNVFFKFQGHGIGLELHEQPSVPNMGFPGKGVKLLPGMCICIEPVVLYMSSTPEVCPTETPNVYQFITDDRKPSSHYENQIYITETGYEVLTRI